MILQVNLNGSRKPHSTVFHRPTSDVEFPTGLGVKNPVPGKQSLARLPDQPRGVSLGFRVYMVFRGLGV